MKRSDILSLSLRSIRGNRLRTGITVVIIGLGIMALVGIITAIKAMNQKFTESFSTMGANGFTIRYKESQIRMGNGREMKLSKRTALKEKESNLNKPVTEEQAEQFVKYYHFPAIVSMSTMSGNRNIVTYRNMKTSPDVFLFGGDENYLDLNGFTIQYGRNLSHEEIISGQDLCILGYDVATKLFPLDPSLALNKIIRINEISYRVVGVMGSRGSTFGFSRDNVVIIGYKNVRKHFGLSYFTIGVKTNQITQLENAIGEAEGVFRAVRKLNVAEESNFALERSDSLAEKAMSILGYLTAAVIIIGLITLIGSAIGLMNIMLVSVAERTKEVGLIKAIGGKSSAVRSQFLYESIMISIIGALLGIISGILLGNLFAVLLQTGFVVPWLWIFYGIAICTLVGLCAGLYPAVKAGKLNPIEALRYE